MKRTKIRLKDVAIRGEVVRGTVKPGEAEAARGLRGGTVGVSSAGGRALLVGTLAACAFVGGVAEMPALSQTAGGAAHGGQTVTSFSIAAGDLNVALKAYEAATGIAVRVGVPAEKLAGFTTRGVSGVLPASDAMAMLLEGTGLQFRQENGLGGVTMVVGMQAKEEVTVKAAEAMPLSRFTETLTETPQSITEVPQFLLQEQGVSTLRDSLRNVPGISLAAGESGAQGDNLTIRGFTARNDIFLDGIRDFGSYYRDSFNYEQVDVLEGPAGIEFGRGSTGGVINQESKVPTARKFVTGTFQLGTALQKRATVDVNEPLGNGMGFRLNAVGDDSMIAGRDVAENRRFGIAPSLSFGMGTKNRATISYFHLTESDTPDYGIPWLLNKPAQGVNRSSYFGFRDGNFLKTNDDIVTLRLDKDINEQVSLRSISRFANYPRNAQITEPQVCSNGAVSATGQVLAPTNIFNTALLCPYTQATDPATIVVNRNQIAVQSVENDLWQQDEVELHFKLAGIAQTVVAGIEGGREMSNPTKFTFTGVPTATLLNPNENLPFSGTGVVSSVTHALSDSGGIYFIDTVKLGRYFDLSGGVRYDYFYTQYRNTTVNNNGLLTRVDKQPTYRAAFVYKPTEHGSVYFDYGTSFNPSAESLSLSVSTSVLPPEENETYEVGTKWDLLRERLTLAGAVFRTEKDNARETSPTNSLVTVEAGNQLVKGMQVSATGRIARDFDVIGGYAYLDSKVIASNYYPGSIGAPLANVPRQTFNAWVTHPLGFRFTGGLGGNYVASRTASSTIPYVATAWTGTTPANAVVTATALKQVPGYWAFNALVKRSITERVELQVNVDNLLNRFYIDEPHPSHLVPGAGRSALFGLNYKF
jgi:catecholate siderophore receptor